MNKYTEPYFNLQEIYDKTNTLLKNLEDSIHEKKQTLHHIEDSLQGEWQSSHGPLLKEKSQLEQDISNYNKYLSEFIFLKEIMNQEEFKDSIKQEMKNLYHELEEYFLNLKLSLEDKNDCFIEIQSGTGGDDAEDLSNLLMKMYVKWSEKTKHKCNIIDIWPSDKGIKSALLSIEGLNSYGLLKEESGIHRFVRHSPFNSLNKRQTSFIAVYVYPAEESLDVKIEEKDLEFSFYKASGAGGQHVNKTESAVRVKHLPTGIIVNCQNERSQMMNKNMAVKFLKVKLARAQMAAQQEKNNAVEKKNISWGNQIRSYVMNPYKLVKDLRSGYETQNIDDFLNGNLLQDCLYQNLISLIKN
jgi:peptide chain release factor 2